MSLYSALSFPVWAGGSPSNMSDRNCVEILGEDPFEWNDRVCDDVNVFACKKEDGKTNHFIFLH